MVESASFAVEPSLSGGYDKFLRKPDGPLTYLGGKVCVIAKVLQAVGLMRFGQHLQKQSSQQAREHAHGQEEGWPARHSR
jgi:hypothetical protein